jgi:hypothetical protein
MNDAALDREIESLLASEPSPQFLARVRTRVAQEPEPRQWRAPWIFLSAAAVTVVILAIVVWPSDETAGPKGPALQVQSVDVAKPSVALPILSSAVAPAPLPTRRTPSVVTSAVPPERRIDIDLPEVVIAENEVRAYTSLVASIRQSRFDVAVPAAPNPDTPLEIKELPPVEPLEMEPIVRVAALQAEGERP